MEVVSINLTTSYNIKKVNISFFFFSVELESTTVVQGNGLSGNSPPLPNGPAPSIPPPPQFDNEDLDKLPPLPPGSPPPIPGICDVPLRKLNFLLLSFTTY